MCLFSGGVNQLCSYLLNRMRKISQKRFQRISAEYLLYVFKHTVRSQMKRSIEKHFHNQLSNSIIEGNTSTALLSFDRYLYSFVISTAKCHCVITLGKYFTCEPLNREFPLKICYYYLYMPNHIFGMKVISFSCARFVFPRARFFFLAFDFFIATFFLTFSIVDHTHHRIIPARGKSWPT